MAQGMNIAQVAQQQSNRPTGDQLTQLSREIDSFKTAALAYFGSKEENRKSLTTICKNQENDSNYRHTPHEKTFKLS